MRLILRILWSHALLLASLAAADPPQLSLRAILVSASHEEGQTDGRLAPYESTLRRILHFESFQHLGTGRGEATVPGRGQLSLGQGQQLKFTTETSPDQRLRVLIEWTGAGRTFMRTGLVLTAGVPAVLGGPARQDGSVYAVLIVAD